MKKNNRHQGFSVLMAMGIITILMIMVTGVAMTYLREFRLSRFSYDEVIASAAAEGAFEYAMLKIRNHESGFEDSAKSDSYGDMEKFFKFSTPRSKEMVTEYKIEANSTRATFTIQLNSSLVIPLFVDQGEKIDKNFPLKKSKKPHKNTSKITKTTGLNITWWDGDIHWKIAGYDKSNGVMLSVYGRWSGLKNGETILKYYQCHIVNGDNLYSPDATMKQCDFTNTTTETEEIPFFVQLTGVNAKDFLEKEKISGTIKTESIELWKNQNLNSDVLNDPHTVGGLKIERPFLILRNDGNVKQDITIISETPFSLPQYTIKATAKRGDASQTFQFSENRSKYFEILTESFTPTSK